MKSIFEHQLLASGMGFSVKEYQQNHFTSPFHFHDLYELILIVKSHGKLYAGNKVMNFNDNEVFMFGPGLAHCFYNEKSFISKGQTAHAIVIFFSEDLLGKDFFMNSALSSVRKLFQKSALGIKVKKADKVMRSFFTDIVKKKGMDAVILLLQLINHFTRQKKNLTLINTEISKSTLTGNDSGRLEPVLRYVFENFKNELSIREAASLAHFSEGAFCRYFKNCTEQTFSQFVNHVRITHAIRLLILKERSISDICYECGYQNMSYFNRQFKAIIGQTPLAYRKDLLDPYDNLVIRSEED